MNDQLQKELQALKGISDPQKWDKFFEKFGPGNSIPVKDQSYARYIGYLDILNKVRKFDIATYNLAHKGTPYYLMAWLQGDIGSFHKAMLFLSMAIEEDRRKDKATFKNNPAYKLLTLQSDSGTATRLYKKLKEPVKELFKKFEDNTGISLGMDYVDYWKNIVEKITTSWNNKNVSLIITLAYWLSQYSEYSVISQLCINTGSSANLLQSHLREGSLIFESLCRILFPEINNIGEAFNNKMSSTFGKNFLPKNANIQTDFFDKTNNVSSMKDVAGFVSENSNTSGMVMSFWVSYALRNLTSHDITDGIGDDEYSKYFSFVSTAIFRVIYQIVK
ncbi:MAG: hypothetical protein ABIE03_01730 [Patescibacteria group bacterium]|nr:hypothetical protein [Patescibacteria group bacterium]